MEVNEEFKHKMKRRSVEIMKKAKRLAELAGEETVSLDFLQSILELQLTHQEATAVALRMLPTKKVADAYTKAQVSCLDFIETVTDEMIRVVENHNKKNNKNKSTHAVTWMLY